MNYLKKLLLIFCTLIVFSSLPLFAQEDTIEDNPSETPPCFELYPFGSLRIEPGLDKQTYQPGETATLKLSVFNEHSITSLNNAKVILQIRKEQRETNTSLLLSDNLILGQGLKYPFQESRENNFSFVIPPHLPSGNYQGYIYITEHDYSVAGLPFTQDVTGAIVAFRVENSQKENFDFPYFQEEKALINEQISASPFRFPPVISFKDLPAKITLNIFNPSKEEKKVSVQSDLYFWDEKGEKINSLTKEITLKAEATEKFYFSTPDNLEAGTYMLKSVLREGDYLNVSKIRFSLPGVVPRIYYSGISQKDEKDIFFACIGNTTKIDEISDSNLLAGQIKIELYEKTKKEKIDELNFEGSLFEPPYPALFKKEISSPTPLPEDVILKTEIRNSEGKIYQSEENIIERKKEKISFGFNNSFFILMSLFAFLFLAMIALGIFLIKERKIILGLVMILLSLLVFLFLFSLFQKTSTKGASSETSSWSGEISRYRERAGYWGFYYANLSLDFHPLLAEHIREENNKIYVKAKVGTSFELKEDNYGSWYLIYQSYDSPYFRFEGKIISDEPIKNTTPNFTTTTYNNFNYTDSLLFPSFLNCAPTNYDIWHCSVIQISSSSPQEGEIALKRKISFPRANPELLKKKKIIIIPVINQSPIANAGPDKIVNEGQSIVLEGSGSDPDGDPITFSWSCTGGTLSNSNIAQPTYTAPMVDTDTVYNCTLTVADDKGVSAFDSLEITVKDIPNKSPIANAGPDKIVNEGQSIVLEGSGSDPDGDPITFSWSCTGGTLSNSNIAQPTYTAPMVDTDEEYECTLTVSDNKGFSSSDKMKVKVKNMTIPGPASANFMCSVNNLYFVNCQNFEPYKGTTVYFKDAPYLPLHSIPSDGATIIKRTWKFNDLVFDFDNNSNPFLELKKGVVRDTNKIELIIQDSNGVEASIFYFFEALTPPGWIEI